MHNFQRTTLLILAGLTALPAFAADEQEPTLKPVTVTALSVVCGSSAAKVGATGRVVKPARRNKCVCLCMLCPLKRNALNRCGSCDRQRL